MYELKLIRNMMILLNRLNLLIEEKLLKIISKNSNKDQRNKLKAIKY